MKHVNLFIPYALFRKKILKIATMICLVAGVNASFAYAAPKDDVENVTAVQQPFTVSGKVTNANGELLVGVTVLEKGTTNGTVTGLDGSFELKVNGTETVLLVSFLGYTTQEVTVGSRTQLTIIMGEDVQALDEVVVTALGFTREKKSLGYAIQEVKSEELTKAGQLSVTGSLTGKVAGVQVNRFGGSVGASSRISIRGNSSFSSDQHPLIVVDGIPIANDTQRSG
ncbi:MAG: carboxypeptidase-like regulatory domain-containing protein, partial [Tannerella sp.]|nr:carboxypeptidase-like regulatory domain-containing protein [Tannerella sp.]